MKNTLAERGIFMNKALEKTFTVTEDKLAVNVGSGSLRVLATPSVIAMMENTAAELAAAELADGITTVGTAISVEHTAPTPFGAEVTARAVLKNSDGRTFEFAVELCDRGGVVARGTHTRVSVKAEKFQKKADGKFDEI